MIRRCVLALALVVFVSVFAATLGRLSFQPKLVDFDFVAFYCGGNVVAAHGDPYIMEPLRTCEHAVGPVFHRGTKLAVPAPLPAYDFAFFSALSRLPFLAASIVWFVLQLSAFALTTWLLARMTGFPAWIVGCTLFVSDFYTSSLLGQVASFSILGIVLVGWSLENEHRTLCALGLALAMIEPHLGVPVMGAVLLWGGRFRIVTVATALVLAAVSIAVLPVPWILDYFNRVLPAHALSEANNQEQFGSLYAAHALGISVSTSLLIAKLNYAAMLLLGIAIASSASRAFGKGMLAFAPVTFVLLGGPFLHVTQVAAALPAALLVAGRSPSPLARAGVALLTIPWLNFVTNVTILPLAASAFFVVLKRICKLGPVAATAWTSLAILVEIGGAFIIAHGPHPRAPGYGPVGPSSLPEVTWKAVIDTQQHSHVALAFFAKTPSLIAIVAVAAIIVRQSLWIVRQDRNGRPDTSRMTSGAPASGVAAV